MDKRKRFYALQVALDGFNVRYRGIKVDGDDFILFVDNVPPLDQLINIEDQLSCSVLHGEVPSEVRIVNPTLRDYTVEHPPDKPSRASKPFIRKNADGSTGFTPWRIRRAT